MGLGGQPDNTRRFNQASSSRFYVARFLAILYLARMTIAHLRRLYEAQPFHPFVLHLADGREISVEHPEYMASAPSGRTVIVFQRNDAFNIVDISLVTDLEVRANGSASRKKHS
jgi:hypothetical protein